MVKEWIRKGIGSLVDLQISEYGLMCLIFTFKKGKKDERSFSFGEFLVYSESLEGLEQIFE